MGIPKLYVQAGRKRHPVTHKLSNTGELFDDTKVQSTEIYVPPQDVREVIHKLVEEKEYEEEELNDEQREVMEDIWLKADEMGN